jgi:hypothetical protein
MAYCSRWLKAANLRILQLAMQFFTLALVAAAIVPALGLQATTTVRMLLLLYGL